MSIVLIHLIVSIAYRVDRLASAIAAIPDALAGRMPDHLAPAPDGFDRRTYYAWAPATGEMFVRCRQVSEFQYVDTHARFFVGFRNRLWANARTIIGARCEWSAKLPYRWLAIHDERTMMLIRKKRQRA